jgi:hypothetical protein
MKTLKNHYCFILFLLAMCLHPVFSLAQYYDPQQQVQNNMEKKYSDPQRQKGRDAIHKQTYENDKRYKDPTNKIQATIVYEDKELNKRGDTKKTTREKMVFGKNGECMVMNEGDKAEMWMIYNYADKANYIVNVKDKSATKMPLINMQKILGSGDDGSGTSFTERWVDTGIKQNINGHDCEKFTYTYSSNSRYSTMDAWVSPDVKLSLGNDYMFGERLNQYKLHASTKNKALMDGFMIRTIFYDKKNRPALQRDLTEFDKTADEKYFDMSPFKVTDIINGL